MIQLQVLNKILKDKNKEIIVNNNLDLSCFSEYKDEFTYILNHINKYNSVPDINTFLSIFPEFEIIEVTEPLEYLISELYRDRNLRYLAESFNNVRSFLLKDDLENAISSYKDIYDKIIDNTEVKCVDILQDTSRYDNYIERTREFDKYYISTGFKELDQVIGGWDREEELATIVARTNQGKSFILLKFAVAAVEQGLNVGLFSGEMSEKKVGYRFDTLVSHISNGNLIHGNETVQNDYKRYIDSLPNMFKGSLKVLTPNMLNGQASVSALRAFVEKEKLDILFVDQHSLLEDDRHAKNPVERASNISRDLKNMQVMTKVPIIAASQQNRTSTENGIDTTHIAQSDRIAQDSTIILALEKKDDLLTIHLIKSRDSENSKNFKYHVDFNHGIFSYIPEDEDAANKDSYEERYTISETSGEDVF